MKFAIFAVFTLAFAMNAQCSIIPWGIHQEIAGGGLSYTAVAGPAALPVPAIQSVVVDPWLGGWNGHVPVVVAASAVEGSYVAKTRGALHTAPLAGHATSVASVNVAPAPGTL